MKVWKVVVVGEERKTRPIPTLHLYTPESSDLDILLGHELCEPREAVEIHCIVGLTLRTPCSETLNVGLARKHKNIEVDSGRLGPKTSQRFSSNLIELGRMDANVTCLEPKLGTGKMPHRMSV